MKTLIELETEKNYLISEHNRKLMDIENEIKELFNTTIDESLANTIKELVSQLESSKDLQWNEFSEIDVWFRPKIDLEELCGETRKELFKEYMIENHFVTVDFENNVLSHSIGPCILINHEGDVLDQDSGKWFISKNDYENEDERNEMIENWMDKNGYFPSIVKSDYYGNLRYISTIKK